MSPSARSTRLLACLVVAGSLLAVGFLGCGDDGTVTDGEDGEDGQDGEDGEDGEDGGFGFELACDGPEPLLQPTTGTPTGFETCDDGFVHRATAATCELPSLAACDEDDEYDQCETSADCTEAPHGYCLSEIISTPPRRCGCVYGCESDADCADGEACACAGAIGDIPRCIPAGCATSADCGDGLCGLDVVETACGAVFRRMACLTETSECRDACPAEVSCYDELAVPPCNIVDGAWSCNEGALCQDCG